LECVSIAPLGGPVVPEVYTSVASWVGSIAPTCASKSPGFFAMNASPEASNASKVVVKSSSVTPSGSKTIAARRCGRSARTSNTFASWSAFSRKIALDSE